jgi:hypothetical protein
MFENYKHRGNVFAECVRALKQKLELGSAQSGGHNAV